MKNVIINEILSLKRGTIFKISDFFNKYNIEKNEHLSLCVEIIKELNDKIECLNSNQIVGLLYNLPFIRK